jgi:cytochrome c oxidase subunit 3
LATTTQTQPAAHGHADAHAHHGPELQHHYETAQQQKEAATLGMWAFLVTEVMLFGGIFMAYIVYRWAFPDVWASSATHLNTPLGTVNTVVLLVSSLTMALAVNAAEAGSRRMVLTFLAVTALLGVGFLGIKAYEYSEKFSHCAGYSTPLDWVTGSNRHEVEECLVPGRSFLYPTEGAHGAAAESHGAESAVDAVPGGAGSQGTVVASQRTPHQLFFFLYFVATGLHAVHMLIGLSLVTFMAFITWRGKITATYFTPIEIGGLYWHLIDIVWVFLFPLFYLVH